MRALEIARFSGRILLRRRGRAFMVSFSIMFGVAALLLFLSFIDGLEKAILTPILAQSSPTTLVVRPAFRSLEFLTGGGKITQKEIDQISRLPHVASVGRQLTLGFSNSVKISLFNYHFETDTPVYGIDIDVVSPNTPGFTANKDVLPVIISPRLVDIFNAAFGESIPGIPHLTPEFVQGRNITLVFGKSVFFDTQSAGSPPFNQAAVVVGVSDKVPPVGLAIPLEDALRLNERFGKVSPKDSVFQQLLIEVDSLQAVATTEKQITELGFGVQTFEELGRDVRTLATILRFVLTFAAVSILLIALFSLFSLLSVLILEQQYNIGILRSLGASRALIMLIFWGVAGVITLVGIFIGLLVGYIAGRVGNVFLLKFLPDLTFLPGDFFLTSFFLFLTLFCAVFVAALIIAYFPLRHISKKDPLAALWG